LPKTLIDFTNRRLHFKPPLQYLQRIEQTDSSRKQNKKQETKTTTTKTKTEAGTPEPPDLISTVPDLQAAPQIRQIVKCGRQPKTTANPGPRVHKSTFKRETKTE
jgi:hypothetical protein